MSRISLGIAVVAAAALSVSALPAHVRADQADPAAAQIDALDRILVDTMKQGKSLGVKGRYQKLAPAIEQAFDLPAMTRFAVGPSWGGFSEPERQALIAAFTRMSVASYAHNFDSFSGERFQIDKVDTRGPDKLVQTRLYTAKGAPVPLAYRMRDSGKGWKVIDVYYQGSISQLTTRRSDFAAPLAAGGAPGLVKHLEALSDKLMK